MQFECAPPPACMSAPCSGKHHRCPAPPPHLPTHTLPLPPPPASLRLQGRARGVGRDAERRAERCLREQRLHAAVGAAPPGAGCAAAPPAPVGAAGLGAGPADRAGPGGGPACGGLCGHVRAAPAANTGPTRGRDGRGGARCVVCASACACVSACVLVLVHVCVFPCACVGGSCASAHTV
jgi:hypothetical protein